MHASTTTTAFFLLLFACWRLTTTKIAHCVRHDAHRCHQPSPNLINGNRNSTCQHRTFRRQRHSSDTSFELSQSVESRESLSDRKKNRMNSPKFDFMNETSTKTHDAKKSRLHRNLKMLSSHECLPVSDSLVSRFFNPVSLSIRNSTGFFCRLCASVANEWEKSTNVCSTLLTTKWI